MAVRNRLEEQEAQPYLGAQDSFGVYRDQPLARMRAALAGCYPARHLVGGNRMKATVRPCPIPGPEKNGNNAAKAGCRVVCADRGEPHALREADDLWHGWNSARDVAGIPTMIDSVFQGEA